MTQPDHTTPEGREALSLRYGNAVIPILRLSNGHFAVFNHAYELCGIVDNLSEWPPICWFPHHVHQQNVVNVVDLHDLGLL